MRPDALDISWQSIRVGEFAAFQRAQGEPVFQARNACWRRVRPFFYRPLLPFRELVPGAVTAPGTALFGGYQFAVPPPGPANSKLGLLLFTLPEAYSLDTLDYNRKRQVKLAAKQLAIRPIGEVTQFKQQAYPVYVSFYERTRYRFAAGRRSAGGFSQWADQLFQSSKALVLGGYRQDELGAVSITQLVEDTLFYSTFFCNNEFLRLHVSDLMLHSVRTAAAGCANVKQIFVGMYKGAPGLDDFYLLRGCNVISKPAFLHLNPLARAFLKLCLPGSYEKIVGHIVPPEPRWPSDELASEPHHLPAQGSAGSLREQQNSRIWTNQEQSRQPKTA